MALDGYEQSANVWIDSTGNQLTYFKWRSGEPNNPVGSSNPERYIDNNQFWGADEWNDRRGHTVMGVICLKCSGYYSIPNNYECHDTDFGTVVVKAYNQLYTATAARDKCSSDANYIHLPIPTSATQNQWFWNYAQHVGLSSYWLGISDVAVEGQWRTDNGDLQTYFNWRSSEPNNSGGNQHYVYTGGSWAPNGKWDDDSPTSTRYVLCTYIISGTAP